MYASEYVANAVDSCQNDDEMDKIGEMFYLTFTHFCESPLLRYRLGLF